MPYIFSPNYEGAGDFINGLARAKLEGKWGYIDKSGSWIVKSQFKNAKNFVFGFARVKLKDKWGIIDTSGSWVFQPQFENVDDFISRIEKECDDVDHSYRYSPVFKTVAFVVTRAHFLVFKYKFLDINIARVRQKGKWGYINKNGKWIIQPQFENAEKFINGFARVRQDGKWGYINTRGTWTIKPQYEDAKNFVRICDDVPKVKSK